MSGVQTLLIKSDQETSIMDVKNALMRGLRSIEGFRLMPEESTQWSKGVYGRCRALRGLLLHTLSGFITRRLNLAARSRHGLREYSGQVFSGFQRGVSDGAAAFWRRKQKNYRRPLIPSSECPNIWKKKRSNSQSWNWKNRSGRQLDHIPQDLQQDTPKNTDGGRGQVRNWYKACVEGRAVGSPQVTFLLDPKSLVARDAFCFTPATCCEPKSRNAYAVRFLVGMFERPGLSSSDPEVRQ